jgi:hypothetical protein
MPDTDPIAALRNMTSWFRDGVIMDIESPNDELDGITVSIHDGDVLFISATPVDGDSVSRKYRLVPIDAASSTPDVTAWTADYDHARQMAAGAIRLAADAIQKEGQRAIGLTDFRAIADEIEHMTADTNPATDPAHDCRESSCSSQTEPCGGCCLCLGGCVYPPDASTTTPGTPVRVTYETTVDDEGLILCSPFGQIYTFRARADYIEQEGGRVELADAAPSTPDADELEIKARQAAAAAGKPEMDHVRRQALDTVARYFRCESWKAFAAEDMQRSRDIHEIVTTALSVVAPLVAELDASIQRSSTWAKAADHWEERAGVLSTMLRDMARRCIELKRARVVLNGRWYDTIKSRAGVMGERDRERASRQDWAVEAMRLDADLAAAQQENERLRADLREAESDRDRFAEAHQGACVQIAEMWSAATGQDDYIAIHKSVTGDLKAAREQRDAEVRAAAIPDNALHPLFVDALRERKRQIDQLGWTPELDKNHFRGELGDAAAWYAHSMRYEVVVPQWPWDDTTPKRGDRRRDLTKAVALLMAEWERLDQFVAPAEPAQDTQAEQAAPRVWIDGDEIPPEVRSVTDNRGETWNRVADTQHQWTCGRLLYGTGSLLREFAPLTEATKEQEGGSS